MREKKKKEGRDLVNISFSFIFITFRVNMNENLNFFLKQELCARKILKFSLNLSQYDAVRMLNRVMICFFNFFCFLVDPYYF